MQYFCYQSLTSCTHSLGFRIYYYSISADQFLPEKGIEQKYNILTKCLTPHPILNPTKNESSSND